MKEASSSLYCLYNGITYHPLLALYPVDKMRTYIYSGTRSNTTEQKHWAMALIEVTFSVSAYCVRDNYAVSSVNNIVCQADCFEVQTLQQACLDNCSMTIVKCSSIQAKNPISTV